MTGGWSSVPNWVIRSETLQGTEKLLYIALMNRANDQGNCWPSIPRLCKDTGAGKTTIYGALKRLEELGLVVRSQRKNPDGGNDSNMYHVRVWMNDPNPGSESEPPGVQNGPPPGPETDGGSPSQTREEHPGKKHPEEKETSALAEARPEVIDLLDLLDSELTRNGVTRLPKRNKANHDAMRLMLDRDGRSVDQIAAAIRWCQADNFWRSNIMSATKLREQYERLQLAAKAERANSGESPGARAARLASDMRRRNGDG